MGWKMDEILRLRREGQYAEADALSKNTSARLTYGTAAVQREDAYTVKSGESWFSIARSKLGKGANESQVAAFAQSLANANGGMGVLRGGAKIKIPGAAVSENAAPTMGFWNAAMAQSAMGGYLPAQKAVGGVSQSALPQRAPGTGAESIGNVGTMPTPGFRPPGTVPAGIPSSWNRPAAEPPGTVGAAIPFYWGASTTKPPRGGDTGLSRFQSQQPLPLPIGGGKLAGGASYNYLTPGAQPSASTKPSVTLGTGTKAPATTQPASGPEIAAEFYGLSVQRSMQDPQNIAPPQVIPEAVVNMIGPNVIRSGGYSIKPDGSAEFDILAFAAANPDGWAAMLDSAINNGAIAGASNDLLDTIYNYNRNKTNPIGVKTWRPRRGGSGGTGGNSYTPYYPQRPKYSNSSSSYQRPPVNWRMGFG